MLPTSTPIESPRRGQGAQADPDATETVAREAEWDCGQSLRDEVRPHQRLRTTYRATVAPVHKESDILLPTRERRRWNPHCQAPLLIPAVQW
jgi:hypothetical protein